MRIVAGDLKGKRLRTKGIADAMKDGSLRPTSAKVRESIFNIIGGSVKDCVFADLYAGSGGVGMEAMSRGAKTVYFVENSKKTADNIEDMLADCGCYSKAVIVRRTAEGFLKVSAHEGLKFDVIFLDPPYMSGEETRILSIIGEGGLLGDDAVVIVEHRTKTPLPETEGRLSLKKRYKYGDTTLSLYKENI